MRIIFRSGLFLAIAKFEENEALKKAGFIWHKGVTECDKGPTYCQACRVGLQKAWWTKRHEAAARLSAYADEGAKAAMAKHLAAVEMSRATDTDLEIPVPKGREYLGYQKAGIEYMAKREGTLLGDAPGLGKTIQALGLINYDKTITSVLVICPAGLRLNWKRETERWLVQDGRRWLTYIVDADAPIPQAANFVITHYNRVTIGYKKCKGLCGGKKREPIPCPKCKGTGNGPRHPILCDQCLGRKSIFCPACKGRGKIAATNLRVYESLSTRKWDLIVCDEVHFLKNEDAKRTKAVLGDSHKKKPGLADCGKRRVFMTGTPIPNRPIEIWPIAAKLAPDEFGNFKIFARRYCNGHEEFVSSTKKIFRFDGASNLEELQERLRAHLLIRRTKEEVLKELPPKRRKIVPLVPSEEARKLIAEEMDEWESKFGSDQAIIDAALSIAEENGDAKAFEAVADKLQYIQRVAFVDMARIRKLVALAKIPAVIEHIKGAFDEGESKLVVFAHHKEVIRQLETEFKDVAVSIFGETKMDLRDKYVTTFQDTKSSVKLIILGITAAGVGITLTASTHAIFAEEDWTPGVVVQAEDRLHRIGQANSVLIEHLVLDGSLDARMIQMIVAKQEIADRALDTSTDVTLKGISIPRPELPSTPVPLWKKILVKEALIMLAMRRDPTTEGGHGFSLYDNAIGQRLATKKSPLSDKEAHLALKLATKYRRQLPEATLRQLEIEPVTPEKAKVIRRTPKKPLDLERQQPTLFDHIMGLT
jgi:SWI/SNF-related matrix-associated actin-dependent regulator 1 of chromatin subfamily A